MPARSTALFTCALATGLKYCTGLSCAPSIASGGRPSAPSAWSFAPICVSGSITRFIGRLESEASPKSRLGKGWPASTPASSRMVVPEFPQSMSCLGAVKARRLPWTTSVVSSTVSISTPSERMAATVQRQSSLGRNPLMTHGPLAMAARITARWEMLLSPGTSSSVCIVGPRRIFQSGIEVGCRVAAVFG